MYVPMYIYVAFVCTYFIYLFLSSTHTDKIVKNSFAIYNPKSNPQSSVPLAETMTTIPCPRAYRNLCVCTYIIVWIYNVSVVKYTCVPNILIKKSVRIILTSLGAYYLHYRCPVTRYIHKFSNRRICSCNARIDYFAKFDYSVETFFKTCT
jgi:hypothetical protein